MKVIFLSHVPPYHAGQVAEVATGYALNYLFPKSLAVQATAKNLEDAEAREKAHVAIQTANEAQLTHVVSALQGATVRVTAPAAASGRLYAAVPVARISQTIHDQLHVSVPAALLRTLPPIKTTGDHQCILTLAGKSISFTLHV